MNTNYNITYFKPLKTNEQYKKPLACFRCKKQQPDWTGEPAWFRDLYKIYRKEKSIICLDCLEERTRELEAKGKNIGEKLEKGLIQVKEKPEIKLKPEELETEEKSRWSTTKKVNISPLPLLEIKDIPLDQCSFCENKELYYYCRAYREVKPLRIFCEQCWRKGIGDTSEFVNTIFIKFDETKKELWMKQQ